MGTGENTLVMKMFGDNAFSRMLHFLLDRRPYEFTKEEMIKETGISRNTLFRMFPTFEKLGMVISTRKIGNTVMYVWNDDSKISQHILNAVLEAGNRLLDSAAQGHAIVVKH